MMPAQVPVQVPAAKGKRSLRHLTASDKINAIQRIHDGESKASVARDIGVAESTFRGWCKKEEKLRHMSNNAAIDNNLKVDKSADKMNGGSAAAAALYGGPPEKRAKLDASLNFASNGKFRYEDMNFKSRNSMGALDLSNIDKGLGGLHYNGTGSNNYTGYKPSTTASLPRDTQVGVTGSLFYGLQHQQIFGNMYSGVPGSSASPSRLSPGQQTQQTNILNALNSNTCWYLHRLKEIENAILNNNSNCSTGNTPEVLSKVKKTELELENKSEVNETSANSPLTSPKTEPTEDITDRKAALDNILYNDKDNVVSNESDCKGLLMTGLKLADKFQQFLEAYHGDPTVTGFDLLQFRTLHNKLKKTAERIRIENT